MKNKPPQPNSGRLSEPAVKAFKKADKTRGGQDKPRKNVTALFVEYGSYPWPIPQIVEGLGHDAKKAAGAADALEMVERGSIDVVITTKPSDIELGEFIKKVKERSPGTKVVLLDGFVDSFTAISAQKAGVDDYLKLPIDSAMVDRLIERIARKKTAALSVIKNMAESSDATQLVSYQEYLARKEGDEGLTSEQYANISAHVPTTENLRTADEILDQLRVFDATETQKNILAKIIGALGGYEAACKALATKHPFLLLNEANSLNPTPQFQDE